MAARKGVGRHTRKEERQRPEEKKEEERKKVKGRKRKGREGNWMKKGRATSFQISLPRTPSLLT